MDPSVVLAKELVVLGTRDRHLPLEKTGDIPLEADDLLGGHPHLLRPAMDAIPGIFEKFLGEPQRDKQETFHIRGGQLQPRKLGLDALDVYDGDDGTAWGVCVGETPIHRMSSAEYWPAS